MSECGHFNITTSMNAKFNRSLYLCFENHITDDGERCNWAQFEMTNEELCWAFFDLMHELKFDSIQQLLTYCGALNSLFNPLIYGIWYSDFRNFVQFIVSRIFK